MVFQKRNIFIFVLIVVLGTILGTMGTISFPIGTNMSYFWPGAVIQTVSGILFGWWGVVAATLFPVFSNALTDGNFVHVFGLIPTNFVQSALPYLIFQRMNFTTSLKTTKEVTLFCFFCAGFPHFLGGILGCVTLFVFGVIANYSDFYTTLQTWWIGNIPCSIVFSLLIIKYVTPALRLSKLLYDEDLGSHDKKE
ncbi:MAG: hypothetical protein ABII18_09575 [bacterium]|nr:hypothetical protein [bacterium]MBU1917342.1 hypothetical protein [bacterium]